MHRIIRGARRALLSAVVLATLTACGGGGGGASSSGGVPPAANKAPSVTILGTGDVRPNAAGIGLGATLGGMVRLDASGSTDPDNDALTFEWSLTSRPEGSTVVLSDTKARILQFKPDVLGAYVVGLKLDDGRGGQATQSLVVTVDNRAPTGSVVIEPSFTAIPTESAPQSVSIGGTVAINAEGSTDPDGHPVSVSFAIAGKPSGSIASLTVDGKKARFDADRAGTYRVKITGTDGRASFETTYVFNADNRAPQPVVVTAVSITDNVAAPSVVTGTIGYVTQLDSSGSSDPDNNLASRGWELVSRPAGSAAALSATTGTAVNLTPDVLGDYAVKLTVTDSQGARGVKTTTVRVTNRQPVAQITTNATPNALPNAPTIRVPANTQVTLRGDGSTDADGDALTYLWTLVSSPSGSTAALSATGIAAPSITPVMEGSYVFRLRVTDPAGALSERTVTMTVGTYAPVAVLDRSRITTVTGDTARVSAAMSFDRDGDTLSYAWQLDARPAGSAVTLASTTSADLSFVPDIPGAYQASVVISDGRNTATATVEVRALAAQASSVALNFAPMVTRYSTGLDKVVSLAVAPNALRLIDPFTGVVESIVLPTAATDVRLSPNGKLAVVKHDGLMSLVDLQTTSVLRTMSSLNATVSFVDDDGFIMIYSQGGGWSDPTVSVINGRTGVKVTDSGSRFGYYGSDGIFANKLNRLLMVSSSVSPSDISYVKIDPVTHVVGDMADSPYHGDYSMQAPLFLTESQDLLFVAGGSFFRSADLRYAGRLSGLTKNILSLANSTANDETLVLEGYPVNYWQTGTLPSVYRRYTGTLMLPETDVTLPMVNGQQSYGMQVFHSSTGRHVLLVQTGSATPNDVGVRYYVIAR